MRFFTRTVITGVVIGSAVGIIAGELIGPDGWALGGAVAGGAIGRRSTDLAESIVESSKAGVLTAVVFAAVFGFGSGVRAAIDTGSPELLAQGLGPFFSIALIYGFGCFIAAAATGAIVHVVQNSR
ncbi:hypothetical protein J2744_000779 [Halorubrum trapanicum]|uniref:DUF5518 domain-containing protein n=1 Tax=Halorubrum trapanicum TaxID=29284 RepID=A0A8J7RBW0_9EURY|nr:hypothetical protein [Halorubrum trapanicum]MBP1901121.1 hypothetical protein [Halorubrum trapanicum]